MTADANMMNGSYKSCAQAEVPMGPSESWFFFCALYSLCQTFWHFDSFGKGMKIQIRTAFATMDGRRLELPILFTFFKALTKSLDFFVNMSVVELLEFYLHVPFDLSNAGP